MINYEGEANVKLGREFDLTFRRTTSWLNKRDFRHVISLVFDEVYIETYFSPVDDSRYYSDD